MIRFERATIAPRISCPLRSPLKSIIITSLLDKLGLDSNRAILILCINDRLLLALGLSWSSLLLLSRRGLLIIVFSLASVG